MSTTTARKRRQPTAEQLEKSAAKRERFKAIAKTVSAMTEDQRAALVARVGAIVTCEGRPLSHYNSCLLVSQLPAASVVGGFWQWKRAGRRVMKGQSALSIWIPAKGKGDREAKQIGPQDAAINTVSGELQGANNRNFICGSVFDITQTEPDTAGSPEGLETEEIAAGHAPGEFPTPSRFRFGTCNGKPGE